MLLALVLERITLLAHAVAQAIAIGGGADAALPLLEDGDASSVILSSKSAGFGEHLQSLGLGEPGTLAPGLRGNGGLGLNGGSQPQQQGCGDQGALPGSDGCHEGEACRPGVLVMVGNGCHRSVTGAGAICDWM